VDKFFNFLILYSVSSLVVEIVFILLDLRVVVLSASSVAELIRVLRLDGLLVFCLDQGAGLLIVVLRE